MKKILIIDKDDVTLRSLLQVLQRYSDLEVIVAKERTYISRALQQLQIDLVVSDIEGTEERCMDLIETLNQHYPTLPVDVLSVDLPPHLESRLGSLHVARRFKKPVDAKKTADTIYRQLTKGAAGQLKGISLTSVLQLMNIEQKRCALHIQSPLGSGDLFMHDGELISARTATLTGVDAAYRILSWEHVSIDLVDSYPEIKQDIFVPLMPLVMEALRLKDEQKLPGVVPPPPLESGENTKAAPITLMEKQIIAVLDRFPGVVEYKLYNQQNLLRFSRSERRQASAEIPPVDLKEKIGQISVALKTGNLKHMVINEKNVTCLIFPFKDLWLHVGLRRDQAANQFLQQFKTKIELPT